MGVHTYCGTIVTLDMGDGIQCSLDTMETKYLNGATGLPYGCDEEWLVDVPPPVRSSKASLTLEITSSTETGESGAPMEVGIKEEQVIQSDACE